MLEEVEVKGAPRTIVEDVISENLNNPKKTLKFLMDGDDALGHGVHRDTLSDFFQQFTEENCFDGKEEKVPKIAADDLEQFGTAVGLA